MMLVTGALSAQTADYYIRVTNPTNLRQSYSLDSGIVEMVPAGTTLRVIYEGAQGNWLQIERNGMKSWMARWLEYTRVSNTQPPAQAAGPAPPSALSNTEIDNLCFTTRQCDTEEEWIAGWHAFRASQGQAGSSQQTGGGGSQNAYEFTGTGQQTTHTISLSPGVWRTTAYTPNSAWIKMYKISGERCLYTYSDDSNDYKYLLGASSSGGSQLSEVNNIHGNCNVTLDIGIRGNWRVKLEKVGSGANEGSQNAYEFSGNGQQVTQVITLSPGVWRTTAYTQNSAWIKVYKVSGERCLYTYSDDSNDYKYLLGASSSGGSQLSEVNNIHGNCNVTLDIGIRGNWRVTLEKL
jgi:uncharacterized protein YgiM (DUF1202 family)